MHKKLLAAALVAALASTGAAAAVPTVSQARIDAVVRMMEAQGQPSSPQMREMVREQLVTAEILRQEAIKQGLDKSADYRAELENMQTMALANRLVREYQRSHPVSQAELVAEYNKLKGEFKPKTTYHARHILVGSEAEANAVLESLKKGKPFDQLAREKSTDTGSKGNGGDLGWNEPGAFVAPFSEAMTRLAKGQVTSKPVKSEFGWHIIKLDDIKTEAAPPMEALRPQLEQRVMGAKVEEYVKSLKKRAAQ
ncbi:MULTISPECIES: peptidylprolyl isomerase [Gulbenkiania]|uniref:peptidylprolyl isomerase n=2 Tax=Gulbenkiania TaxID=397456 RepID=A0A0K6GZY2_9NEIS|nr:MULTISPECIES: peptidylprolyl isomerase [Gulbenkiania]TCW31526.1 peptidyl-prolyl cis-trans isomerase C [Gulbenkiania mobilis]CUA84302.1 PPIC-type PPIASE domain [Gulbenkiania indica]